MIPSLLQIPSAVSDSKLHSVLPNNGKGDFTFDRSTGATRINKDGLIEEVGYFSSELVQNGNFSELGSELIPNGDFESNVNGWATNNANATFTWQSDKSALFTSTSFAYVRLNPALNLTAGTYKVAFDVLSFEGTLSNVHIGLGTSGNNVTTTGSYTYYYVSSGGSTEFQIRPNSGGTGSIKIDNVSVKQVDPNDRWTLGTGYTYGDGVVNSSSSDGNFLTSSATLVVGKSYKISFDVTRTSGELRHYNGGFTGITANATGTFSGVFTPTETILRFYSSAFVGSVDNVSVVEVQGDRPRLSYDITNGVVEDQPHLLLEPSSTNLLTFSEDFSQWENIRTTDALSSISSPSNTTNVYKIIPSVDNNNHRIDKQLTLTNGNTYSLSFFAKKGEYNCIQAAIGQSTVINNFVSFNLNTGVKTESGTIANSSMTLLPNGWYRCSLTAAAGTIDRVVIGIGNNDVYSFVGDASSGLYLWGAMIEEKGFSTSYIKTAGTTITRAAETCNNSKPSVNSTEGVLYCEIAALADDLSFRTISVSDGTTSNRSVLRYGGTSNFINVLASSGGSNVFDNNFTLSEITDFNKIAIKYKVNDYALWVNGNEVKTDTSGAAPVGLSQVQFSNAVGNSNIFYGKVKGVAVYNEALTDAQLIQLTS